MGSNGALRILIADDHDAFADALEAILSREEGVRVIGRASNGRDAARLAADLEPDVVLMDISMPVLDGFAAARIIRQELPETCVVFLTGSAALSDVEEAKSVGASGYVTKDRIAADLVDAIRAAAPPCLRLS